MREALIKLGFNPETVDAILDITLEQLRKPTPEMVNAGIQAMRKGHGIIGIFQAMIDEARNEQA